MFRTKPAPQPENNENDPFHNVKIISVNRRPDTGEHQRHSVADAMAYGHARVEQAKGFSVNDTEISFHRHLHLCDAAWEVMALVSCYGRERSGTVVKTLQVLESYLAAHQEAGKYPVGEVAPYEIARNISTSSRGYAHSPEDFANVLLHNAGAKVGGDDPMPYNAITEYVDKDALRRHVEDNYYSHNGYYFEGVLA